MSDLIKREDAIRELYRSSVYKWSVEEDQLAHTWAISIIESLPSAETHEIRTETHGVCSNLISRADVIRELVRSSVYAWSVEQDQSAHNWAIGIINSLPPADAVPKDECERCFDKFANKITDLEEEKWIPCSERLPEKGEVVLITNGKGNVRCGQYRSEYDVRGGTHYWWWKGKTVESVIAWMPLPTPYKGGDDE